MKKLFVNLLLPLAALFVFTACQEDPLTQDVLPVEMRSENNFTASLSGANEVPPNESAARGVIQLKISKDETSISYRLIASNIDSVTGAHLHLAPSGTNGPVVVLLFGGPVTGRHNGVLSEGTITATNVVGPLAGDLQTLIDTLRSGAIYTNVHTRALPGGEIRGQLE